jgi:hypothetical protein
MYAVATLIDDGADLGKPVLRRVIGLQCAASAKTRPDYRKDNALNIGL